MVASDAAAAHTLRASRNTSHTKEVQKGGMTSSFENRCAREDSTAPVFWWRIRQSDWRSGSLMPGEAGRLTEQSSGGCRPSDQ